VRFVWTELILAEVATRLRAHAGAERAVAVVRELLRSRRYELLLTDAEILEAALGQLAHYHDHRLSLTDCASFDVIRRLKLDGAFAFDLDFVACGFRMPPEAGC
jgi:predicted nucleic acid-binding protein